MPQRFIHIAVVYVVIAAGLGMYMGVSGKFTLAPVHAHLALVGWASLALGGVIYHLYPAASRTRLATAHFWLHNTGLPLFMAGLAFALTGDEGLIPVVGFGASLVLLGLICFAVNVLRNVKSS
jgi:hypothetical protein